MSELTLYEREIELALNKTAKGIPWQDRDDLKQEARIAIIAASAILLKAGTPKALAYKLARNRIVDVLRKRPPHEEDIDKPFIRRLAEKIHVHFPDMDAQIDASKAAELTKKLPTEDMCIIRALFNLDGDQMTVREMAVLFGTSEDWVDRKKKQILTKLKSMMTGETE